MRKLNRTAKLAFFNARREKTDSSVLSVKTGTSKNVIKKMLSANRRITDEVADEAFYLTMERRKNSIVDNFLSELGLKLFLNSLLKNSNLGKSKKRIIAQAFKNNKKIKL